MDRYVKVILPLRLDWEPVYRLPDGYSPVPGERVCVRLAGREYVGVIHSVDVLPEVDSSRILDVEGPAVGFCPVTREELVMWEFISDYYLCTIGEVYKAAYSAARVAAESKKARTRKVAAAAGQHAGRRRLSPSEVAEGRAIFEAMGGGRPVFAGNVSEALLSGIVTRVAGDGRQVLVLVPEKSELPGLTAGEAPVLEYNSSVTAAMRRDIASALRLGKPCVVVGTRSSVLLPFTGLGLVVVTCEYDASYKQSEPAPRYNGRDVAVKLASVHGCPVILTGGQPSLETVMNCMSGKFCSVAPPAVLQASCAPGRPLADEVVDTGAERRKNGMLGQVSRKLRAAAAGILDGGGRVLVLVPWKDSDDVEIEFRSLFPDAGTHLTVGNLHAYMRRDLSRYGLVALVSADFLLKAEDFRADEKALRLLTELRARVKGTLWIQTADAAHPVFATRPAQDAVADMLALRRDFNLPPFTRVVDIIFRDSNEARFAKMSAGLLDALNRRLLSSDRGVIRIGSSRERLRFVFARDREITRRKSLFADIVNGYAKEHVYGAHIHLDADPL